MSNPICRHCGKLITGDKRRSYCSRECRDRGPNKAKLRAVEPDERAEPVPETSQPGPLEYRVLSVTDAAREGTRLELLVAMRDRIAKAVDNENCAARDLAALTKRLQELERSIEAMRVELREEAEDAEEIPDEPWNEEAI